MSGDDEKHGGKLKRKKYEGELRKGLRVIVVFQATLKGRRFVPERY